MRLCIHHHLCNIIRPSLSRAFFSPLTRSVPRVILKETKGGEEEEMALPRVSFVVVAIVALLFALVLPSAHAQSMAPAPSPASDGTSIDHGIAYGLMLIALVLTYLIHPLDV